MPGPEINHKNFQTFNGNWWFLKLVLEPLPTGEKECPMLQTEYILETKSFPGILPVDLLKAKFRQQGG
jgi:hypothetical protein